jgi:hypothetical protein
MNPATAPLDETNPQSGATIRKPIDPARLDKLQALLTSIGEDITGNPHVPFTQFASVHFMTWFVVDADDVTGPLLFFELNVDGPVESSLRDIVAKARPGIDLIYGHCTDYPAGASDQQIVAYLIDDNIGYDCFYIGWRGLTVDRILAERKLRVTLEDVLDAKGDTALATMTPGAVRKMIQDHVRSEPELAWARTFPPRPFLVRHGNAILTALEILAVLILLVLLYFGWPWWDLAAVAAVAALVGLLRWKEATDSVASAQPEHWHVEGVASLENRVVQNHFASVEPVKPGLFRMVILKVVLRLIHFLAAVSLNKGNLSGITTIHFARWVVIDRGRRLLFLSNYDGSWENYLDDFIDRASPGLTAIWSNTAGFPESYFLIYGGATDELRFKTITRSSQVPSLTWYSAYPDLSVQNIQTNAAIREGLFGPMDAKSEAAWLALF